MIPMTKYLFFQFGQIHEKQFLILSITDLLIPILDFFSKEKQNRCPYRMALSLGCYWTHCIPYQIRGSFLKPSSPLGLVTRLFRMDDTLLVFSMMRRPRVSWWKAVSPQTCTKPPSFLLSLEGGPFLSPWPSLPVPFYSASGSTLTNP